MSRFAWLLAPDWQSVSFAIRVCLSVAISLYLAFWLRLDDAYWAFINVAILIQPLPGYLVVRGFARLLGTAVAASMAIILIASFAQSYTLFSAGLIAWITLMVFCASFFRNNLSYGFVLAGYVTAIIGVRSMGDPTGVFSVAVARSAETGLAVVVAATVSVLLAPSTTARRYRADRTAAMRGIGAHLRDRARTRGSTGGDVEAADDERADWQQLVRSTLELEQTRRYARFDAPGFSEYNRLARRLNYELLSLVGAMTSMRTYLNRLRGEVNTRSLVALEYPAGLVADDPANTETIKKAFDDAYETILDDARSPDNAGTTRRSIADWVVISRALDLANRMRAAVIKHGLLLAERGPGMRVDTSSEFSAPNDWRASIRTTIRAAAAMSAGALIWANYDEPALAGMMVLLSVLTTLFAMTDDPAAGARGFGIASIVAGVVAFVVNFFLLPLVHSYAMLMLCILPVVFVGALAMATPAYALIGRVGLVIFALLIHPANDARQTFVGFAETFMGVCLAVLLALAAFRLIFPVSPRGLLVERMVRIFRELARGFTGRRELFETRVYDLMLRLPVAADQGHVHVDARAAAFAAANMGVEARSLDLLARRVQFSQAAVHDIRESLSALRQLFVVGYPRAHAIIELQRRIDTLADTLLTEALAAEGQRRRRYAVRAAVAAELLASALADYAAARDDSAEIPLQLAGAPHAA